jgi:hypothetical protein
VRCALSATTALFPIPAAIHGKAERRTAANDRFDAGHRRQLWRALGYRPSGAAGRRGGAGGPLQPGDVTVDRFHHYTCLADLPEPDLFIRTGGEQRISNFLLWQMAYTELYFTDRLWPDYDADDLESALRRVCQPAAALWPTGEQVAQGAMLKQRIITAAVLALLVIWAVLKLPAAGFGLALLAVLAGRLGMGPAGGSRRDARSPVVRRAGAGGDSGALAAGRERGRRRGLLVLVCLGWCYALFWIGRYAARPERRDRAWSWWGGRGDRAGGAWVALMSLRDEFGPTTSCFCCC